MKPSTSNAEVRSSMYVHVLDISATAWKSDDFPTKIWVLFCRLNVHWNQNGDKHDEIMTTARITINISK